MSSDSNTTPPNDRRLDPASGNPCGKTVPGSTCKDCIDFLMDYLDGSLTPQQHEEFNRHIAICPECVRYMQSYKQTIDLARASGRSRATEPMPEQLVRAILTARKKN